MRRRAILLFILVICTVESFAQFPGWAWAKTSVGGTGGGAGRTVATDASGNIYVAGWFSPSITFGNTTLNCIGNGDIFLVKYDPMGNVLWAKMAAGLGTDYVYSIVVDNIGNIYMTGWFTSPTIAFDTITLTNADTTKNDLFIVKYNSSGDVQWANNIAGTTLFDYSFGIAVDGVGNSYITGYFESPSLTFGATTLTNATGGYNFFLAKYNTSGNPVWAKGTNGNAGAQGKGVSVDAAGNIYVTGCYDGNINFGAINLVGGGAKQPFLVKYDSWGTAIWGRNGVSDFLSDGDVANAVTTDPDGNIYIGGYFNGQTMNFGSITLTNNLSNSSYTNIFLTKYDSLGTLQWANGIGGDNSDAIENLETDTSGNIYLAGWFLSSDIYFDTTHTVTLFNCCSGGVSMLIAKYETDGGNVQWAKNEDGGGSWDQANDVAADPNGSVYVAGYYGNFPMTLGTTTLPISGPGGSSVFLGKVGTPNGISEITQNAFFSIQPNPTSGLIDLHFTDLKNETVQICVADVLGQVVMKSDFQIGPEKSEYQIDLSKLSDGIYSIMVVTGVTVSSVKVVKE